MKKKMAFKKPSEHGLTLIELVFSGSIMSFVIFSVYLFNDFVQFSNYSREADTRLINEARRITERLVSGYGGANACSLREAAAYDDTPIKVLGTVSPSLTYRDSDNNEYTVEQSGQNIRYRRNNSPWVTLYDPNGPAPDDPSAFLTRLTFSQNRPGLILMRLVLGKRIGQRWVYGSSEMHVALRNHKFA